MKKKSEKSKPEAQKRIETKLELIDRGKYFEQILVNSNGSREFIRFVPKHK